MPVSPAASGASSTEAPSRFGQWLLRFALHRWFRLTRGMTLGVRVAVFDAAGRVFLVRHTYVPGWHLPGGGIEPGQTAREAVAAELREEGNLVVEEEPRLFGVYLNRTSAPRDHVVLYVVRRFRQSGPRRPDREIAECGFFPLDGLPPATTAATRRRLGEIAASLPPAPEW